MSFPVEYRCLVCAYVDVDLEFKSTSFSEELCKDLQNICSLTPGWHPKILSMCLNSDVYALFFFFSPLLDIIILFSYIYCQGIGVSCSHFGYG